MSVYMGDQKVDGGPAGSSSDLSDYVTKVEFDEVIGDISLALDLILGGDAA